ncbi:hypothetical protein [Rhodococcus rhodnii]|nr:hypothetical protein [Rhodococcus rhodnii]
MIRLDRTAIVSCVAAAAALLGAALWESTYKPGSGVTQYLASFGVVLVGVAWGATSLSKEFESETNIWSWTQGVTRARWFWSRISPALLGAAAFGVLLTVIVEISDRRRPLLAGFDHMSDQYVATHGVFLPASALLAVSAGLLLSVVTRLIVPAIALTLISQVVLLLVLPKAFLSLASEDTSVLPASADPLEVYLTEGHVLDVSPLADGGSLVTFLPNAQFGLVQGVGGAVMVAVSIAMLFAAVVGLQRMSARRPA